MAMTGRQSKSLVRQMQEVLQRGRIADERTLRMIEQLRTRLRRLQAIDGRFDAVAVSRYVEACIASDRMARSAGSRSPGRRDVPEPILS